MRMVSKRLSPFLVEVLAASAKPITVPPRRCIADSKERRVRVLGSKNKTAMIFRLVNTGRRPRSACSATARIRRICSREKSAMEMTSLPAKVMAPSRPPALGEKSRTL